MGVGGKHHPRPGYPPTSGKESEYTLYRELGEPQGCSEQVRKISPPSEFNPRTVQSVASSYNDYISRD